MPKKSKEGIIGFLKAQAMLKAAKVPDILMLLIAVLNQGRLLLSSLLFEFLICVFRNLLKNRTDGFRWSMTRGSARLREFFSAVALQMSGWQALEVRTCNLPLGHVHSPHGAGAWRDERDGQP